jgi:hypothetical protein
MMRVLICACLSVRQLGLEGDGGGELMISDRLARSTTDVLDRIDTNSYFRYT